MDKWKNLNIKGIAKIEKSVVEFDVWELSKTPYGKFKVKIFETKKGKFVGYTNLKVKDEDGCPTGGVGYGHSISEALEDTINYFLGILNEKENWDEEDFECADPYDF